MPPLRIIQNSFQILTNTVLIGTLKHCPIVVLTLPMRTLSRKGLIWPRSDGRVDADAKKFSTMELVGSIDCDLSTGWFHLQ
jgi:hypothetical protein